MIENRLIHTKTGKLHFLDEVYGNVVFTMDGKCFPINEIRNLSKKEKETILINHICNSWDNETVKKIRNRIKWAVKNKPTENQPTSWLKKILTYFKKR